MTKLIGTLIKKIFPPEKHIEKRRRYRYSIPATLKSRLVIQLPSGKPVTLKVIDLNEEAVAGSYDANIKIPAPEVVTYPAELIIDTLCFSFTGQLIRYGPRLIVLKYTHYEKLARDHLISLFPIFLGMRLKEKEVARKHLGWINGPNYTDLFIRWDSSPGDQIRSFTFVSEDNYFFWNCAGDFITGSVTRATYATGLGFSKRKQNPVILDACPDSNKTEKLSLILESSSIDETLKERLVSILRRKG